METRPPLQLCRLAPEMLDAPLPYDLFNSKGALLARKGARLQGDVRTLMSQSLYRPCDYEDGEFQLRLKQLEDLVAAYGCLVADWHNRAEDVLEVRRIAGDLVHLCGSHSDLCIATVSHLTGGPQGIRHAFAAAVVAVLLGEALGWNLRRQHTLARAALTMDLSLLRGGEPAGGNIRHPELSAAMLLESTCVDLDWFAAVDQHHENLDGSGYPVGLKGADICPEARVLRVADTWCDMVLVPPGKARKTPRDALQEMRRYVGNRFDPRAYHALKNLMGPYPPGTFVRLANRETAIVMRWDRQGSLPRYATAVLSPNGEAAREFKVRPLQERDFLIRNYTYLDMAQMARFSISRIWAMGAV
ncbi:MAG TPA: HD domain-containing phosphohydrolase [Rhodocyclaceae bacterium]